MCPLLPTTAMCDHITIRVGQSPLPKTHSIVCACAQKYFPTPRARVEIGGLLPAHQKVTDGALSSLYALSDNLELSGRMGIIGAEQKAELDCLRAAQTASSAAKSDHSTDHFRRQRQHLRRLLLRQQQWREQRRRPVGLADAADGADITESSTRNHESSCAEIGVENCDHGDTGTQLSSRNPLTGIVCAADRTRP